MTFKKTDIARAVQVFNALHNGSMTEDQGHAFIGCLEMVLKQPAPEIPQVIALDNEGLLEAVVRAHGMQKAVDLVFGGVTVHIDPAMTMTEAYEHAIYVIGLNEEFPAVTDQDMQQAAMMTSMVEPANKQLNQVMSKALEFDDVVSGPTMESLAQQGFLAGRAQRVKPEEQPAQLILDHAPTMAALLTEEEQAEAEAQKNRDAAFDALELKKKELPPYTPLTTGYIHFPERNETIEQTIQRLSPLAPVRVRLCGLVMTVREDITTMEMIEEAHRIIKSGISDANIGPDKQLELDEEMLDDGTLRTARRVWRRGYQYRLDVMPHDRTEIAQYHIHMKTRPTQTYMDQHLQLMYDKKAKMFLNITNGIDHFENVLHLYCTASGRAVRDLELTKMEKQMAEEFAARNKPYYQQEEVKQQSFHNAKKDHYLVSPAPEKPEPAGDTEAWEDQDCDYRVRYYHGPSNAWRYSYFENKPTAQDLRLRDSKEGKATVETKPAK